MYPEMFRIGPLVIGSYGVMLALAFIAGTLITTKLAERRGLDNNVVLNLIFIIMISAIIGSRLLYVLFHLEEFQGRWIYTALPVQKDGTIGLGGLIFLGGVLGAILAGTVYVRLKNMPLWKFTDVTAPSIAFGIFLGRIGCFLNGCCFGKACTLPWGVQYPQHSAPAAIMGDIHVHPTQLYESFYGLIIFLVLIGLEKRHPFDGLLSGTFLILYGISRFTVDIFRYYETQMFILGELNFNQIISLVMLGGGIVIVIAKARTSRKVLPGE